MASNSLSLSLSERNCQGSLPIGREVGPLAPRLNDIPGAAPVRHPRDLEFRDCLRQDLHFLSNSAKPVIQKAKPLDDDVVLPHSLCQIRSFDKAFQPPHFFVEVPHFFVEDTVCFQCSLVEFGMALFGLLQVPT